jgi:hypothetical protein
MATLAELLKSAGIADEVAAGLPKELSAAIETHITAADQKLTTAAEKEAEAVEQLRIAGLTKEETRQYVEKYGNSLTEISGIKAKEAARVAYLKSLKEQGYAVPDDLIDGKAAAPGAVAAVPGSPAIGGNVDEKKILGNVGLAVGSLLNLSNEYSRLYGQPIPDDILTLNAEAERARKPLLEYAAEKYKFASKREEIAASKSKEHDEAIRKEAEDKVRREYAERNGSNPNLRSGVTSNNSFVPKIKSDDFQKSGGNVPTRQRNQRMLDNLHKDLETARTA